MVLRYEARQKQYIIEQPGAVAQAKSNLIFLYTLFKDFFRLLFLSKNANLESQSKKQPLYNSLKSQLYIVRTVYYKLLYTVSITYTLSSYFWYKECVILLTLNKSIKISHFADFEQVIIKISLFAYFEQVIIKISHFADFKQKQNSLGRNRMLRHFF